jgi:hypothetical protein
MKEEKDMKEKTMYVLAVGVMLAILFAIVGDYLVAAIETQTTGEAVEVSSDVMTLVQTALGGSLASSVVTSALRA